MNLKLILIISFSFLLSSCSLLNSGTVNLKYTTFKTQVNDINYSNKNKLGDASFSIRNVQHPKRHGRWDLGLKLSPSIHYERHTVGTLHEELNDSGQSEQYPDIKIRRLSLFANLKLILHTPIGAFVLTGGYGGAMSKLEGRSMAHYPGKNQEEIDRYNRTEIRKLELVYYKFFSPRVFMLFGPRYYKEEYEQVTVAFRVGFYWGKI